MGFLGVYRAVYDYVPQAAGELAIDEGDVLYVLDKNDNDGWWKAKKRAGADDEDEPIGLVPNNYVQEVPPLKQARALYEYTRQTDEELSFPEDALLNVFDTSDPDWILVGTDNEFGFAPSNYIELQDGLSANSPSSPPAPPSLPARPQSIAREPASPSSPANNAAAALAGVMQGRSAARSVSPPPQPTRPTVTFNEPEASDEEPVRSPALPSRPRPSAEPPHDRHVQAPRVESPVQEQYRSPGGFHMYNINEMVSVMGKRKKMPTTLGINLGTGMILVAPERAQDGPTQEWSADRMTHYSREGKHVFMELVRPSKSVDFHAGAKDTAEEIVAALGELAGAVRAEGLREVIMAGTKKSQRRGQVLYDFMAQGEDEVTVAKGDEVIVVDDSKSEEWWQVRRLKNGKEGVVPSSYIELTGVVTPPSTEFEAIKATVEQNRLDEIRLTKEAIRAGKEPQQVGPGMPLPERGSSLTARENGNNLDQQRSRRENGHDSGGQSKSKPKPDSNKVRTWTDRSKSFSVDAQFLGLKDGKIHLHKMNGVKIAVPITKMSREDLEYVESTTGISLEDEKPLSDVKKDRDASKKAPEAGATVEKNQAPDYDWFQFFLSCDVAVGLCERYAQAFAKDSMDESVLPDVDASILRNLGLREGDIIKVIRTLDAKYGRDRSSKSDNGSGGLFSGPGGALRNNTRKGRPAPAVQTSDVVDPTAFTKKDAASPTTDGMRSPTSPVAASPPEPQRRQTSGGFDDDAWDVKPSKQPPPANGPRPQPSSEPSVAPTPAAPALTGSMQELSLLTTPLQPSKAEPQPQPLAALSLEQPPAQAPATQQRPGASPSFFSTVPPPQQPALTGQVSPQSLLRQRPAAPQMQINQGTLMPPPPPQRPLSAPQSVQQSAFAPPALVPQMTGALQGQVAPPGQSLSEINQLRLQQQYTAQLQQPQQPAIPGYLGGHPQGLVPYQTGTPGQFMQPMMTGAPGPSPFGDPLRAGQFAQLPPQPTGFQGGFQNQQSSFGQPPANLNTYLPPPLEPQRTGMPIHTLQPQATGMGAYNSSMPSAQPLLPQQTGPAPPVRFGVTAEARKLAPQPTGRRANLAQATPQNPFGF